MEGFTGGVRVTGSVVRDITGVVERRTCVTSCGRDRAQDRDVDDPADLDAVADELVGLYRRAVRQASADAATDAALSLGRALDAISRVKRSLHPDLSYDLAQVDIADARRALARIEPRRPDRGAATRLPCV